MNIQDIIDSIGDGNLDFIIEKLLFRISKRVHGDGTAVNEVCGSDFCTTVKFKVTLFNGGYYRIYDSSNAPAPLDNGHIVRANKCDIYLVGCYSITDLKEMVVLAKESAFKAEHFSFNPA